VPVVVLVERSNQFHFQALQVVPPVPVLVPTEMVVVAAVADVLELKHPMGFALEPLLEPLALQRYCLEQFQVDPLLNRLVRKHLVDQAFPVVRRLILLVVVEKKVQPAYPMNRRLSFPELEPERALLVLVELGVRPNRLKFHR
jgi:hypothetical protein